jgi:RNA 2',3'-cyclic 3'-phosphodiesterase
MTLPPVIRIFFAIDLPPSAKEELGSFVGTLKKKSKSKAIRWTRPENLHITLQFLAEVDSTHLQRLIEKVRGQLQGVIQAATLTLGSLHLFPNPYRPRVIVLDVAPQEVLRELASLIGKGIQSCDYPLESRPFRAHLTLGRIKYAKDTNTDFLSECAPPTIQNLEMSEVVLFRSEPQEQGSTYTVLEKIKLNA